MSSAIIAMTFHVFFLQFFNIPLFAGISGETVISRLLRHAFEENCRYIFNAVFELFFFCRKKDEAWTVKCIDNSILSFRMKANKFLCLKGNLAILFNKNNALFFRKLFHVSRILIGSGQIYLIHAKLFNRIYMKNYVYVLIDMYRSMHKAAVYVIHIFKTTVHQVNSCTHDVKELQLLPRVAYYCPVYRCSRCLIYGGFFVHGKN